MTTEEKRKKMADNLSQMKVLAKETMGIGVDLTLEIVNSAPTPADKVGHSIVGAGHIVQMKGVIDTIELLRDTLN